MTIKKVGGKFRVVSEHGGKNLGESETKEGAVKRLRQVEYFKHYAKCVVDPSLVKDLKYMPVVFQMSGHTGKAEKESEEKDFPSTGKMYALKDVKQPEFPSTPFTGEAYAQSFHNPHAGDGNTPDTQMKGSEHVPKKGYKQQPAYIKDMSEKGIDFDPEMRGGGPPDSTRKEIRVRMDNFYKKRRQILATDTPASSGGPVNPSPGGGMERSVRIAGRKVILKQHPNEFKYPVDRGESMKDFDPEGPPPTEHEKRKAFFNKERMKTKIQDDKIREYNEKYAYLGRSEKIKLTKGGIGNLVTVYTQNQPLHPILKPIVTALTGEDDEEEKNKGLKIVTFSRPHVEKSEGPDYRIWTDPKKVKEVKKVNPQMSEESKKKLDEASEIGKKFQSKISGKTEKTFRPNPIEGGIGDKLQPKDVDEDELAAGIEIEQEHVKENKASDEEEKREVGQDIALDHLEEDPEYYTHLAEMERKAKHEQKDKTRAKKILAMGGKAVKIMMRKGGPPIPKANPPREYDPGEEGKDYNIAPQSRRSKATELANASSKRRRDEDLRDRIFNITGKYGGIF